MRNAKSGQACRQNESHRRDNVNHKDLNMHCLLYVHRDSVTNRYERKLSNENSIYTFGNNAIRRKDKNIAFNCHVCILSGECREDFQIGGVLTFFACEVCDF